MQRKCTDRVIFFTALPKKLKYGKPRLGESMFVDVDRHRYTYPGLDYFFDKQTETVGYF